MNYRKSSRLLGFVLLFETLLFLLPLVTALIYHEEIMCFVYSMLITGFMGFVMVSVPQKSSQYIAKDGFFVVTMAWVLMSLFGAIPYLLSPNGIHSIVDAVFETVSGFTTTGVSILSDPSTLSKSLLLWRALTQWVGGMGVLVFLIAILPLSNDNSMHVLRAEMAGPTIDKIVPRTRDMAIWMYGMYTFLTVAELVALLFSGVPFFDSLLHTFTTAATGGFSTHAESIAFFQNPAAEWVITIFMALFGVNFNIFFLIIMRKFKRAFKNEELWIYIAIIIASSLFIAISVLSRYENFMDSIRQSAFQVVSVMTTTGFSVTNSGQWPVYDRMLLLLLMIFGACAGSTAGGVKISRLIILVKYTFSNFKRFVSPRSVSTIKQDEKKVSNETIRGTAIFFMTYMLVLLIGTFFIALDGFDFESSLSVTISALGDNGMCFGEIGNVANVGAFSAYNKWFMCFLMLIGRLEIFPVAVLLLPSTYKKK